MRKVMETWRWRWCCHLLSLTLFHKHTCKRRFRYWL